MATVSQNLTRIRTKISASYDELELLGAEIPEVKNINNLPDSIRSLGEATEKNIEFIDYDGTEITSYSFEEAESLTELPALPTRTGFINKGWNYTLADIKSAIVGDPDPVPLVVGCTYMTSDGVTRIYVTIPADDLTMNLAFSQLERQSVLFDWGDGTTDTPGNPAQTTRSHTYSQPGDYVISFTNQKSYPTLSFAGNLGGSSGVHYSKKIKKVEIGDMLSLSNFAFNGCDFENISIPEGVEIGANTFASMSWTKALVIPRSTTSIENGTFEFCSRLEKVSIPTTVTSIGNSAFSGCGALRTLSLPSVSTIGEYAFQYCGGLSALYIYNVSKAPYYSFAYCSSLKTLHSSDITSVGGYAFVGCTSLESIGNLDIEETGENFNNSFNCCMSLRNVGVLRLPLNSSDGTKSVIGTYCFRDCKSLRELVIDPDDSTHNMSISNNAFYRSNILVFDFTACTKVATLDNANAFSNTPNDKKILIPASLATDWKDASNWTSFAAEWLAQDFSPSTSYAVGDFCKYNGSYYKCKTAGAAAWNVNRWTLCTGLLVSV